MELKGIKSSLTIFVNVIGMNPLHGVESQLAPSSYAPALPPWSGIHYMELKDVYVQRLVRLGAVNPLHGVER